MASLRTKIYTVSSSPTLQVSYHYPFANDPDSMIKTWVLPLSQGYHVRIHKVTLGHEYRVSEGGFCIGVSDDNVQLDPGKVTYGNTVSSIEVLSNEPVKLGTRTPHPGMHNLCPLAHYPMWSTKQPLSPGEYVFVSTVFFSTEKAPEIKPDVQLDGNTVTVCFGEHTQTISL